MLNILLESRAGRARHRGGTSVSFVIHGGLILIAVVTTGNGKPASADNRPERTIPIYAPAPVERWRGAQGTASRRQERPSMIHPTIRVPSVILAVIPPVDVVRASPIVEDWRPANPLGVPTFGRRTTGRATAAEIPFATAVEKPAVALDGNPAPRYPDALRRVGIEGTVVIQVVVDRTGMLDTATAKVVSSDHPLFAEAVIAVLPKLRFLPAETGGATVKMWVIIPFNFEVRR